MAKAPLVLGGGVQNFQDTYRHPQNGQLYPCYRFPKREACLMAVTMTSLELVAFINSHRKEGDEPELRHDHFMVKVPKILGEEHAPKFRDMLAVTIGNGATRQSPIYRFPKREACLMAMSYSYEMQALVFDRMTELEEQAKAPPATLTFLQLLKLSTIAEEARLALEVKVVELTDTVATRDLALFDRQVQINQMDGQLQELAEQTMEAAPKLAALERIVTKGEGDMTVTIAAKSLQVGTKFLFDWLCRNGYIYRRAGGKHWQAYSFAESSDSWW